MPNFIRLKKAFQRVGIAVSRTGNVVSVTRNDSAAQILLPDSLPLEQKAVEQLLNFASVRVPGSDACVCKACATPDFHPGAVAPVGSIVATTSDMVVPAAIGTDINCGMRLTTLGLTLPEAELRKDALIRRISSVILEGSRDVPCYTKSFLALFDSGPTAWVESLPKQGIWQRVDLGRIVYELDRCVGLDSFLGKSAFAPEALVANGRDIIRDPALGTVGSGNHFVELQSIHRILDRQTSYQEGLAPNDLVLMVHSGSRDIGFYVGQRWADKARLAWTQGVPQPDHRLYGLTGVGAQEYLVAMGVAARWAWANRVVLTELVRLAIEDVFGTATSRLVVDVPHNVVLQEDGFNVHRKGATPAHSGQLALIPGSMGDYSYLVKGLGNENWVKSCSHGAGRAVRRQAVRAVKSARESLDWHCVTLREERRAEEAPHAYKRIGPVIESQEEAGLIRPVVELKPWITFKA